MPKIESSYEALNTQLEEVVANLQSPDVDIDDAVKLFEQALKLTKQLEKHLQDAENHITQLKATFNKEV